MNFKFDKRNPIHLAVVTFIVSTIVAGVLLYFTKPNNKIIDVMDNEDKDGKKDRDMNKVYIFSVIIGIFMSIVSLLWCGVCKLKRHRSFKSGMTRPAFGFGFTPNSKIPPPTFSFGSKNPNYFAEHLY